MGVLSNQWVHFGHSGSKHSEYAQFLTIAHIVDPLWRTFKMYPIFNHWVHCGQVLSVPTMYSPCAHWVYVSLSPVSTSSLVTFAQDVNYTKMEGFKRFKASYNCKNACAAHNDPRGSYPWAKDIYQAAKGPGCLQWTFDGLSLQDFIEMGAVAACCHLKPLSLAPYTRGEGAWKSTRTSWVHCRLWLKVPATYPPITDWVHSKCSCRFQVEHMMWVHLWNILNVILTCAIHLIPHNS